MCIVLNKVNQKNTDCIYNIYRIKKDFLKTPSNK